MFRNALIFISLFMSASMLTSCYRMPLTQGNVVTDQEVAQIKPGMTPEEVRAILGDPVINNTFDNHRVDYIYTYQENGKPAIQKRVFVFFVNNQVKKVGSDNAVTE